MNNAKFSISKQTILMSTIFVILLSLTMFTSCQSRSFSRFFGKTLELKLPEDFAKPISFSTGREGEKDLFYMTSDSTLKVKTYTDTGMMEAEIEFVR